MFIIFFSPLLLFAGWEALRFGFNWSEVEIPLFLLLLYWYGVCSVKLIYCDEHLEHLELKRWIFSQWRIKINGAMLEVGGAGDFSLLSGLVFEDKNLHQRGTIAKIQYDPVELEAYLNYLFRNGLTDKRITKLH